MTAKHIQRPLRPSQWEETLQKLSQNTVGMHFPTQPLVFENLARVRRQGGVVGFCPLASAPCMPLPFAPCVPLSFALCTSCLWSAPILSSLCPIWPLCAPSLRALRPIWLQVLLIADGWVQLLLAVHACHFLWLTAITQFRILQAVVACLFV